MDLLHFAAPLSADAVDLSALAGEHPLPLLVVALQLAQLSHDPELLLQLADEVQLRILLLDQPYLPADVRLQIADVLEVVAQVDLVAQRQVRPLLEQQRVQDAQHRPERSLQQSPHQRTAFALQTVRTLGQFEDFAVDDELGVEEAVVEVLVESALLLDGLVVEHQRVDQPHFGPQLLERQQALRQVAAAAEREHQLLEDDQDLVDLAPQLEVHPPEGSLADVLERGIESTALAGHPEELRQPEGETVA